MVTMHLILIRLEVSSFVVCFVILISFLTRGIGETCNSSLPSWTGTVITLPKWMAMREALLFAPLQLSPGLHLLKLLMIQMGRGSATQHLLTAHITPSFLRLMRLREGTGGQFYNMILTGRSDFGVQTETCAGVSLSSTSIPSVGSAGLYWSSKNIINTFAPGGSTVSAFDKDSSCSGNFDVHLQKFHRSRFEIHLVFTCVCYCRQPRLIRNYF